ncbi:MAG: Holliday junction branch migration protein RuvA [Bacteroidales bacterium]|nr:Holliday junction branch migration protein RuvA [Bacteroidales bacterium]
MLNYIQGKLDEVTPAYAVVDCGGVGYLMEITLNTYTAIKDLKEVRLLAHEAIREDAHSLFGFFTAEERDMFRLLIGISGVGPATARMVLSTLTVDELRSAIIGQNAKRVQSVKGIGPKAAQRIVLELHDKVGTGAASMAGVTAAMAAMEEVQAALLMLGFAKPAVEKALTKLSHDPACAHASVEELIKLALGML